jgi:branched-chain amino acid transport system ATP-binding protein
MKNEIESMLDRRLAHLKVDGLGAGYGSFLVLRDLTLEARPGLTVILGPNGAGKTTLLKALAGLLPRAGEAVLDGATLPSNDATVCVRHGLALVAEGRQLFPQMSVTENLELGAWLAPARLRRERLARAFEDFPRLAERAAQLAGTMSGGEQQMVAIGRALMSKPDVLLLDEPSLGLSPLMCKELFGALGRIRENGVSVLLVEQNARQSLTIADRGYLIETGRIVGEGWAADLRDNPAVRRAYLGGAVNDGSAVASPATSSPFQLS